MLIVRHFIHKAEEKNTNYLKWLILTIYLKDGSNLPLNERACTVYMRKTRRKTTTRSIHMQRYNDL